MAGKSRADSLAKTFDQHWTLNPKTRCHEWQRSRRRWGYGQLYVDGENVPAHRFAWERVNGPIPDGMHVCHRCDNPPCVNPDHLFLGTNTDNRRDSVLKERHARGDGHGLKKLGPDDVLEIRRIAASGAHTDSEIAAMFGIKQTQASRIISGKRWKHLPGAMTNRPKPAARGERNIKAKLTIEQVRQIREMHGAGFKSPSRLAEMFGVSKASIWRVTSGTGWRV